MILNIGGGGGLPIRLIVTAPTGSAISVIQGTTVLAANEVDGVWTFAIPSLGVWTIHATIEGQSFTQDVDVSKVGQYNVTLEAPIKTTLNDNDWATIKSVADESKGANYWAVGDTKEIVINGKLSDGLTLSNYNTWVYIIGFDHNSDREGTGIAFQGFKTAQSDGTDICLCDSGYAGIRSSGQWFNMNNNNSTSGGWNGSDMRNNTMPVVKAALPVELTSVIKMTSIYTDNTGGSSTYPYYVTVTQDELYLLAEFEIFGREIYANAAEQNYQKQYAYYVAGNSKVKYKHDSTATAAIWWERSVVKTHTSNFCIVNTGGTAAYYAVYFSIGLTPVFKVGSAKYTPVEYISSTGTQYIDTGIRVTPENYQQLKMSVTCEKIGQGSGASNWLVDGSNIANAYFYMGVYNGKYYYGCGTADHDTGITAASGKQTFTLDIPSSKFTVSDTVDVSISTEPVTASASLYLFGFNYNPVRCYAEKVYSCQIYIGDTLVRDFIAAKDEWGNAGLYDKVEGKFYYNAGTGVFSVPNVRKVSSVSVGTSLFAKEGGTNTEFIVVNQGNPDSGQYDSSCDGTWLLRKDGMDTVYWNTNYYSSGQLNTWLNGTYLNTLDIADIIKQVKIPYYEGTSHILANGLSCKVFQNSCDEIGFVGGFQEGAKLSYFPSTNVATDTRTVSYGGQAKIWVTRTRKESYTYYATRGDGAYNTYGWNVNDSPYVMPRPCFIIPSDTYADENNNILTVPPNAISTLNVGDSVFVKENGVDTEYLLVHKGNPDASIYDSSCDGAWLLRRDGYNNQVWDTVRNRWQISDLCFWLRDTYIHYLNISSIVKSVKIPYAEGLSTSTVYTGTAGLDSKVFLLSGYEVGYTTADNLNFPVDGTKLGYFESGGTESARLRRIANLNGSPSSWWLRSPNTANSTDSWSILYNGLEGYTSVTNSLVVRPAFIVPLNTPIDSSNNIIA